MAQLFSAEHFAAFCESMLGSPYWYGTCLDKCTKSLLTRKTKQYPSHYTAARRKRYESDIAAGKTCADCVGACKGYAWKNGKTKTAVPDKSADGMFSWAKSRGMQWGEISSLPEIPGIALHSKGHVGYYVGNGYAVEWRGFNYGCVKTKVKSRSWEHWFYLPFIDYGDTPAPAEIPLPNVEVVTKNGGSVNLREGDGTSYNIVTQAETGTKYPYVATAENGWHAVRAEDKILWISGEYSKLNKQEP